MRFLFFVILFFQIEITPQVISVLDSTSNLPIENVSIVSLNKKRSSITNSSGQFNLSDFHPYDSLKFTHISHQTKILVYKDVLKKRIVLLNPSVIEQKEITVLGSKYSQAGNSFSEEIKFNDQIKNAYLSIGDILKSTSSIFIKDYGGFSGAKIISSRGMSGENTIVLFNEARVNDLSTGIFDLSSVSSLSTDKIEFYKDTDPGSEYSSAGGILKIFSGMNFEGKKLNLGMRISSDNYQSIFTEYKDGTQKLNFSLSGERSYSPNHYKYRFEDNQMKRENAQFNRTFLSSSINYSAEKLRLNLYSNYNYLNSGIPGFVVTNNFNSSLASNINKAFLSILNTKYFISDKINLSSVLSYNHQIFTLTDPEGLTFSKSDKKESYLSVISALIKSVFKFGSLHLTLGDETNYSSLKNTLQFFSANESPEKISRIFNKFFSGFDLSFIKPLKFLDKINFSSSMQFQSSDETLASKIRSDNLSYNLGINFIPAVKPFLIIKSNFSSSYRYPTYNERYYSNLYNHYELNPEKYKSFDAGIEGNFDKYGSTSFSISYFLISGDNKIIWIPTRLAIQTPRNIAKVITDGLEIGLDKKLFNNILQLSLNYTYTNALNKSKFSDQDFSYNKQLIYIPKNKFNFNITVKADPVNISLFSSYAGDRFYTTDNDPNYVLPGYFETDFSALYNFNLLNRIHSVSLTIYNIFNEDYYVIQSYPMPLRTFLLTLNVELL